MRHPQNCGSSLHRCGKAWWPRRPKKPVRCPVAKVPTGISPAAPNHTLERTCEPNDIDEGFRSGNGKGSWKRERARERYGGPLLGKGTQRTQGDERSRKDLAGNESTHGTGIRRKPGEGSTESARPINTQFPAPRHFGAGINPTCRAVYIAAGGPERLQQGWPDALRASRCHHRDAGVEERRRGSRGVVRLPLLRT